MVKKNRENKYEFAREFHAKLILSGSSIARFCREAGVSYDLYRNYIRGIIKGTRAGKTKIKRLIEAMDEFMAEETDKTPADKAA